jgi:hypothetical protein
LNASATPATVTNVEFPYINPGAGPMPEHVVFEFTNYPLPGDARIMVFKASDYASYGSSLQDTVTALLAGEDANQTLPDALTTGDFFAQAGRVAFQNGHGVRFITEVLTGLAPINNRDIFYFYQGITNDGAYFVSAIFPVNASFLVADGNADSPTPADGVPFPWSGDINYPDYLSAVTEKLNNADPTVFSPRLADLDALIASIRIVSQ